MARMMRGRATRITMASSMPSAIWMIMIMRVLGSPIAA
jgi:hypothetical protein